MEEHWIKVSYDTDCTISFNDCVDVVLDKKDVEFLIKALSGFLMTTDSIRGVCFK